jgi:hypothetical protein
MGFSAPTPNQELRRIHEQTEEAALEVNRRMLIITKYLIDADEKYEDDDPRGGDVALDCADVRIHGLGDFMSTWIAAIRESVRVVRQQEDIKALNRGIE